MASSEAISTSATSSILEDEPLSAVYKRSLEKWNEIENNKYEGSEEIEKARDCLNALMHCAKIIRQAALISKNETLDDVQTPIIKYLLCEHLIGLALQKINTEPEERLKSLQRAQSAHDGFLSLCEGLELVSEKELMFAGRTENDIRLDAANERMYKIQRHKAQRQAKQELEMLTKSISQYDDEIEENDGIMESRIRRKWILQLRIAAQRSVDEIKMIEQEIPILKHMINSKRDIGVEEFERRRQAERKAEAERIRDPKRKGLDILRIPPTWEFARETIRGNVFQDGHNAPTMTLDEFAQLEIQQAQERSARQAESEKHAIRKYQELEKEGLEDDHELVEKATYRDRAWEDWRDETAKGAGNTKRI